MNRETLRPMNAAFIGLIVEQPKVLLQSLLLFFVFFSSPKEC
jgi:hypothetical protein